MRVNQSFVVLPINVQPDGGVVVAALPPFTAMLGSINVLADTDGVASARFVTVT
jgi:hypothetical protein